MPHARWADEWLHTAQRKLLLNFKSCLRFKLLQRFVQLTWKHIHHPLHRPNGPQQDHFVELDRLRSVNIRHTFHQHRERRCHLDLHLWRHNNHLIQLIRLHINRDLSHQIQVSPANAICQVETSILIDHLLSPKVYGSGRPVRCRTRRRHLGQYRVWSSCRR